MIFYGQFGVSEAKTSLDLLGFYSLKFFSGFSKLGSLWKTSFLKKNKNKKRQPSQDIIPGLNNH